MRFIWILLVGSVSPALHAATCNASSAETRARLIELYTSEGCSSCPPADRWLSALPASPTLVPLAFHVDYWDKLGWRDPYGQPAFSQRQRQRNTGLGWVYTPQLMLDGEDWRQWSRGLPASKNGMAPVHLSLDLTHHPEQLYVQVTSRFTPPASAHGTQLYVALYENQLVSRVNAGENAARTLRHDYVVRELAGPLKPDVARHRFRLSRHWQPSQLGVAAFVINGEGDTLQALARMGCP